MMMQDNEIDNDRLLLRFRPSPDVIAKKLDNEVVLVHLGSDKIFHLNRTGARFWELLCAGDSRGEIQEQMLKEFDVEVPQLSQEIETLIGALKSEKIVLVEAEP